MTPAIAPHIDDAVRVAINTFIERLQPEFSVYEAILFGSRARGSAQADSDADVAVILDGPPQPFMTTKLAMADKAFDAMLDSGILVQPLPIWKSRQRHSDGPSPNLLRNIDIDGIHLWPKSTR